MRLLIMLVLLFTGLFTNAQISEINQNMSQGSKPGLSIQLMGTDTKTVETAWSKYMKEFKGKTKKDKGSGEIFSDDATVKNMSSNSVDIYAKAIQEGTDVKLNVWFDLGGAFASKATHADAYAVSEGMLTEFSMSVSTAAVEEEIEAEEDNLEKMEGDMKKLLKEKLSLEDEIAKAEQKIVDAKAKIEENKAAQVAQQSMIDEQMKKVGTVKDKLKKIN